MEPAGAPGWFVEVRHWNHKTGQGTHCARYVLVLAGVVGEASTGGLACIMGGA